MVICCEVSLAGWIVETDNPLVPDELTGVVVTSELGDVVLCTWLTVEMTDATELESRIVV